MFKPGWGVCTGCQRKSIIVVKKGYCKLCNERSKGKSTTNGLQRTAIKKKAKKATGESGVFMAIWSERKHICQCCGVWLGDEPKAAFFAHILSKGAYVRYRLNKLNIMLMCHPNGCHHEYDCGNKNLPKFKLANMIADKLKCMYYGNDNANDIDSRIDNQRGESFPS